MADFRLTVLTPDKRFWDSLVLQAVFSTPAGRIGIMAGHTVMAAAISEGTLEIQDETGQWRVAAVSQGFASIEGHHVELFVDTVEWSEDIDTIRAAEALRRAEERLTHNLSRVEFLRTQTAVARATARLKASKSRNV